MIDGLTILQGRSQEKPQFVPVCHTNEILPHHSAREKTSETKYVPVCHTKPHCNMNYCLTILHDRGQEKPKVAPVCHTKLHCNMKDCLTILKERSQEKPIGYYLGYQHTMDQFQTMLLFE